MEKIKNEVDINEVDILEEDFPEKDLRRAARRK